ncbi:hypothetical protein EE612_016593 [Oryza sativa]|nr:hypothetical protein EE612_016593 [Oryza sativa]
MVMLLGKKKEAHVLLLCF